MGRASLPAEVVRKITAEVRKVLANTIRQKRLSNAGVDAQAGTGADLVKLIRSDKLRFEKLVRSANINAQ